MSRKTETNLINEINKNQTLFQITSFWLSEIYNGKSISSYFEEKKIKSVGIYGVGILGRILILALQKTDVQIKYLIDRREYTEINNIPVIKTNDSRINEVDAIIVTPIYEFENIKTKNLMDIKCKIISLEDIIYAM